MTDPGPSRKRPKLEEPDESDTAADSPDVDEKPFVNHPTLYFDDGNVILTTGRTLFCVHRSLLSKHSPVFRELFEQKHDRFRGLTQITMEETREDLEALLGVIYDGLRYDVQDLTVETFPTLATLLRMSKQYEVEKPAEDIVARIRAEWPATLAQHDAKEAKLRAERARRLGQWQMAEDVKAPQHQPQPQQHQDHFADNFGANNAMHLQPHYQHFPPPQQRHGGAMLDAAQQRLIHGLDRQQWQFWPVGANNNDAIQARHFAGRMRPVRGGMGEPMQIHGVGRGGGVGGPMHAAQPVAGPSNAPAPAPAPAAAPPNPDGSPSPAPSEDKEDLIVHPASVIGLLRECGYADPTLFFPLFYALSRTTWQFGGAALGHHLAPLAAADMERLVVGIERVRAHHAAFAVAVPTLDPLPHHQGMDGAHARLRCLTGASQLWATMVPKLLLGTNDASVIPPGREPLEEWAGVVPNVAGQCARHGVCADCGRAIVARIEAFRREFWAKLPQFFELV